MSLWTPDYCFELLEKHESLIVAAVGTNEAATRMRAIDTILFDVLGWDKLLVDPEKYCREVGYADYAVHTDEALTLILEAKKSTDPEGKKKLGESFVIPKTHFPTDAIGFGLLAKECPEADKALRQAAGYAASLGARYIAISNGHQWLIALSYLDSVPVEERSVIVFESLDAIKKKFRLFWDCFSPKGVASNHVLDRLLDSRKAPPPAKLSQRIVGYPAPALPNQVAEELALVLGDVWSDIENEELELDFLNQCYVVPTAKNATLEFAKDIIEQKYRNDESVTASILEASRVSGMLKNYSPQRPVIVLGNIGNGKTTFLRYLRLIEASKALQKYIQLDIDFLDRLSEGKEVADYIYRSIEEQLQKSPYNLGIISDSLIRAALGNDLKRFKTTSVAKAYKPDSPEYIKAELAFIDNICSDKHEYLKRVFVNLRAQRQYSIAIFIDNLDRRNEKIQEEAYLRASAIARDWACLVFICLRPATFYRSSKSGVLDSVSTKMISITSADADHVLTRRLKYAKQFAEGKISNPKGQASRYGSYFSFELPTAAAVLQCLIDSLRSKGGNELVELFKSASNNNTRSMLDLVKKYLTSKFLDTKIIADNYKSDANYRIRVFQVVRTLMLGDSVHYDPSSSPFCNLYDVQRANPLEHFTRITALNFLLVLATAQPQQSYARVTDVVHHLCKVGYTHSHSTWTIKYLFERKCIESRDPVEVWSDAIADICISQLGKYHVSFLLGFFPYLDAASVDTPIMDDDARGAITDVRSLEGRLDRCAIFVDYLDRCAETILDTSIRTLWKENYRASMESMAVIQEKHQNTLRNDQD